ncbi:hypothetical protein Snas_0635 [Stackebrandtia nassauensis DSM 44728]|uniref:Uncharacterized protein n=1 Tax=Stackebrandtia nassauensis (strain DSM 44728 / CIP 108903 / NRRL B-16338 / NBRC 102104 / LLR-40K-21) TaxID=446470 RepID=D3Q6V0_STANL|nr:hypothetical protein Snas_0635 [Stackebrandtia nassauensis DSM 44728]
MTVIDRPLHTRLTPPTHDDDLRVDVYRPAQRIRVDTLFWHHRSPFAGTQEQLDELRHDADNRAAARAAKRAQAELIDYLNTLTRPRPKPRPSVFDVHRPAIRRLRTIVHVGLVPMLWAITTCACGERWPCNSVKQHLRKHLGWTIDITDELKRITRRLPKPETRVKRWWRKLRTHRHDRSPAGVGGSQPTTGR